MNERERTILSLYTLDGILRPFLWFRSHKKNEIVWAPYGLKSKQPVFRSEWPGEEETAESAAGQKRYYFNDASINHDMPVDHIMSHADGTFHIKGAGRQAIYKHTMKMLKPPSESMGPFLEFIAISEVATLYPQGTPKGLSISINVRSSDRVELYGVFAGAQFQMKEFLTDDLVSGRSLGPVFKIGQYQAGFAIRPAPPSWQLSTNRPRGTFITFRFHMQRGAIRQKMFLFD
jgi:hypothetical protein